MSNIKFEKNQFLGHDIRDIKEHYPDYDIQVVIKDGEVVGTQTHSNSDTTVVVEIIDNIIISVLN